MQVHVTPGKDVAGSAEMIQWVQEEVQRTLARYQQIIRVEVHLNDENSRHNSGADDKSCMVEARLAGHQPVAVHHQAAAFEPALRGALEKLVHALEHTLGRLADRRNRVPAAGI